MAGIRPTYTLVALAGGRITDVSTRKKALAKAKTLRTHRLVTVVEARAASAGNGGHLPRPFQSRVIRVFRNPAAPAPEIRHVG